MLGQLIAYPCRLVYAFLTGIPREEARGLGALTIDRARRVRPPEEDVLSLRPRRFDFRRALPGARRRPRRRRRRPRWAGAGRDSSQAARGLGGCEDERGRAVAGHGVAWSGAGPTGTGGRSAGGAPRSARWTRRSFGVRPEPTLVLEGKSPPDKRGIPKISRPGDSQLLELTRETGVSGAGRGSGPLSLSVVFGQHPRGKLGSWD